MKQRHESSFAAISAAVARSSTWSFRSHDLGTRNSPRDRSIWTSRPLAAVVCDAVMADRYCFG